VNEKLSLVATAGIVLFLFIAGILVLRVGSPVQPHQDQSLPARTGPITGGLDQPANTPTSATMVSKIFPKGRIVAQTFVDRWGNNRVSLAACSECKRETAADATRCGSCQVILEPAAPGTLQCSVCNGVPKRVCKNCLGKPKTITCWICDGSGIMTDVTVKSRCYKCKGTGQQNAGLLACHICLGKGTVVCRACNGRGTIN